LTAVSVNQIKALRECTDNSSKWTKSTRAAYLGKSVVRLKKFAPINFAISAEVRRYLIAVCHLWMVLAKLEAKVHRT